MPLQLRAWINPQPYTNSLLATGIVREAPDFMPCPRPTSRPVISMAGGSQLGIDGGTRCADVRPAQRRSLGATVSCIEQADALAEAFRLARHRAAVKDLHIPIREGEPT